MLKKLSKVVLMLSLFAICTAQTCLADGKEGQWDSISYTSTAVVYEVDDMGNVIYSNMVLNQSPPLPVSAHYVYNKSQDSFGSASSHLSKKSMSVRVEASESTPGYTMIAGGTNEVRGSYTAKNDVFRLSHKSQNLPVDCAILFINDEDMNEVIGNVYLNGNSGDVAFTTPRGHKISFVVTMSLAAGFAPDKSDALKTGSMNYVISTCESTNGGCDKKDSDK